MSSLKSIFVSLYLVFLGAALAYAATRLAGPHWSIGWLGVALTTAPFLALLSWLMLTRKVARTSPRLPSIIAFAVTGLALTFWSRALGEADTAPVILASIGLGAFLAYAFWYSDLGPRRSTRLSIGAPFPSINVVNTSGQIVSSDQWRGRASILMFFRGNWCPLCMAQINELAALYREIDALGVRVALISPQPHAQTAALARKHNVVFEFYADRGGAAARALGIDHPGGLPLGLQALGYDSDTVLPTVIILDANGTVVWAHETDNYRVRPEPETYLQVLRHSAAATV